MPPPPSVVAKSGQPNKLNFRHLCHDDNPISWPAASLYKDILSSTSELSALYNALVTEITLCCRHGEPLQEYLILCIKSSDPNILDGLDRVWARCERSGPMSGGVKMDRPDAASDTIRFSVNRPKLRSNGDRAIMECAYETLKIEHIADLLKIIDDVSPTFNYTSVNRWWFSVITIASLQQFRADWKIKPSEHFAAKAIDTIGQSAARGKSQEIAKQFSNHWHPGQRAKTPMSTLQAWGIVPHQSPITVGMAHVPVVTKTVVEQVLNRQATRTLPSPPKLEPEPTIELKHDSMRPLEIEPTVDHEVESEAESESDADTASPPPNHWTETRHADGDAVNSATRLFTEPHDLDAAKSCTGDEAELVMDMLQEALDDTSDRLSNDLRARSLRLLQDISWHSERLPKSTRIVQEIRSKTFNDSGGEAIIWTAYLENPSTSDSSSPPSTLSSSLVTEKRLKVIVRDARPPEDKDWSSPAGIQTLRQIRRQVIAHLQLRHPNILPLLGVIIPSPSDSSLDVHPLSVITPFAELGHALKYLSSMDRGERPMNFLRITGRIASAIDYLHTRQPPIIHGDVHARNIVINAQGTPLLCDFGLSRVQHEVTRTFTQIIEGGKYRFLAPELIFGSPTKFRTSQSTDCYAFAMTILEMATLRKPFAEYDNELAASRAAERGIRPKRPRGKHVPEQSPAENYSSCPCSSAEDGGLSDMPKDSTDKLWRLLEEMWSVQPQDRPALAVVEEIVEEVLASLTSREGNTL